MILYDTQKRLVAISDKTLEMLGFRSFEEFTSKVNDIAQLFLKQPGYIHEFRSFHWIDYVLTNSTITHRALLHTKDGKELEVFINITPLNTAENRHYYLVALEPNTFNECYAPAPQEKPQTIESTPPSATIEVEAGDYPKPNLTQIGEELNLGEDIVLDFIKEFVNHSLEKLPEINEAIKNKDVKTLKTIIHTLRGVSANLRLKPAQQILAESSQTQDITELTKILERFYAYILSLAHHFEVEAPRSVELHNPGLSIQPQEKIQEQRPKEQTKELEEKKENLQEASRELGLSFEEYQSYLKELINEIKINLAYNNYTELHKLASFARNLYLQECAKYLDEVSVNQNPDLVKKCLHDLEELKKEPNPFIITPDDLKEALDLIQIEKSDFIDILEDLAIELKTLKSIKMKKEKFLKKARQLKSLAESMRLGNLVLLLNNIISNYPLDRHLTQQLEESIRSLEKSIKEL